MKEGNELWLDIPKLSAVSAAERARSSSSRATDATPRSARSSAERYAPGQHGQGRSKTSEYGSQLREKQKARRYYGVLEKQFRSYFAMAEKRQGITGENLLAILETRLDNVVYRLGFAMSRAEARQLVTHGHFTVDGRKVNIPSFLVKPGMVITLKDSSKSLDKIKANVEANASRPAPKWLDYDANNMVGKVVADPGAR